MKNQIERNLYDLEIDLDAANFQILCDLNENLTSQLPLSSTFLPSHLNHFPYDTTFNSEEDYEKYLARTVSINMIFYKEIFCKRDDKAGRIHNNITNIICEIGNVCECIFEGK